LFGEHSTSIAHVLPNWAGAQLLDPEQSFVDVNDVCYDVSHIGKIAFRNEKFTFRSSVRTQSGDIRDAILKRGFVHCAFLHDDFDALSYSFSRSRMDVISLGSNKDKAG
jgi:hypothetical protein